MFSIYDIIFYIERGVKMKSVREIIRNLRTDHDIRQSEIANVLGINQQYYSKYETGEYEIPVRHIITLAKYYSISTDYLLGLTDFKGNIKCINEPIDNNITLGKLMSNIFSLDKESKKAVVEYVNLLIIKKLYFNIKNKNLK